MKTVKTSTGKSFLYPRNVYCYRSILKSFQELLLRPGFIGMCEKWRNIESKPGCFSDIYDGKVWKEFRTYDGQPSMMDNRFWICHLIFALHLIRSCLP